MATNLAGDDKSKNLFAKALTRQGHIVSDCDETIERYKKRPDLISEKDGVTYWFELKQRNLKSTDYSDIMITSDKMWMLANDVKIYLVFFYTDGKGYILDARTPPDKVIKKAAKKTTRFADRHRVIKEFIIWNTDKAIEFTFEPDLIY